MTINDYKLARKHYIRIIYAGYRINYFNNILNVCKCYDIDNNINIESSIIFAYQNKQLMRKFIGDNIEIYRRQNKTRNDCFVFDEITRFKKEKDNLKILAVDNLSINEIEIITMKDKFEYKIFTRLFESHEVKKKNEINGIKKLFPNIEL